MSSINVNEKSMHDQIEHADVDETFGTKVCCIAQVQLKCIVTQTLPHNHLGIQASVIDLDSTVGLVMNCTHWLVVKSQSWYPENKGQA